MRRGPQRPARILANGLGAVQTPRAPGPAHQGMSPPYRPISRRSLRIRIWPGAGSTLGTKIAEEK